jgi:hypothetical protein
MNNFVCNISEGKSLKPQIMIVDHFAEMSQVALVHPLQTFKVSARLIVLKCDLFTENPRLAASPYTVRSPVSLSDFQEFASALEGNLVKITNDNFKGLSALSEEFRFGDLAGLLSQFRDSDEFKAAETIKDSEVGNRVSALEERMQRRNQELETQQCELMRRLQAQESATEALVRRMALFEAELLSLRIAPVPDETCPAATAAAPAQNPASPTVALPRSEWNSAIFLEFPKLFEDFKDKQFILLWRGGRDGFGARQFHNRCNAHSNTLTVILDTKGNIFGGFTPLKWNSMSCTKGDPTLKSFLFTLRNPHNFPARRFVLKAEAKDRAMSCSVDAGPCFCDIGVADNCNANTVSYTQHFGLCYTNDTGLKGETFFTGSKNFQVKEIEVFEITD